MKKFTDILLKIFAYGIVACLFAGGLSLFGYLVGMLLGPERAEPLCKWVFKTYLPLVIKITSVFTGIGLLSMYLSKQKALTATADKK